MRLLASASDPEGFHAVRPRRLLSGLGLLPGRYLRSGNVWWHESFGGPARVLTDATDVPVAASMHLRRTGPQDIIHPGACAVRIRKHELLIIAPGAHIAKVWPKPVVESEFLQRSVQLRESIPGPDSVEPRLDGHALLSDWIAGSHAQGLTAPEKERLVRSLLGRLAESMSRSAIPDDSDFIGQMMRFGERSQRHRAFFREIAERPEFRDLRHQPIALQHGDVSASNTLALEDGTLRILDWSPITVGFRPFWMEAAQVTMMAGLDAVRAGTFERELGALWAALDARSPSSGPISEVIPYAYSLFHAAVGLDTAEDGTIFSRTIEGGPAYLVNPAKAERALIAATSGSLSVGAEPSSS